MGYRILVLGIGGALARRNFPSNYVLRDETTGAVLLIDFGGGGQFALEEQGIAVESIDGACLSHLHFDHFDGLNYLATDDRFTTSCRERLKARGLERPLLFIPQPLVHPLETISGFTFRIGTEGVAPLSDFFTLKPMTPGGVETWRDLRLSIVPMPHIVNKTTGAVEMYSYGLMVEREGGGTVFFTTDTCTFADLPTYRRADLIIHDCSLDPNPVHISYDELKRLPKTIRPKVWLTHYGNSRPRLLPGATKDGFAGFLREGQWLDVP